MQCRAQDAHECARKRGAGGHNNKIALLPHHRCQIFVCGLAVVQLSPKASGGGGEVAAGLAEPGLIYNYCVSSDLAGYVKRNLCDCAQVLAPAEVAGRSATGHLERA